MAYHIIKDSRTSDITVSAYLLDKDNIRVILISPSNKYDSLSIRWQYRYITDESFSFTDFYILAVTKSYEIWDAVLNVKKKDINFVIKGMIGGKTEWLSEVGSHESLTDALSFSFIVPMINDAATSRCLPNLPDWLYGSTIYEIFVDRYRKHKETDGCLPWNNRPPQDDFFHRSKFGGTLQGIVHSIIFDGCYLKKLGIGSIYMTPIFQSPSNHKYDAIDYYQIDTAFGDKEDLKNLSQVAHENGIRIIFDGVFNHCSDKLIIKDKNGNCIDLFSDLRRNGWKSKYANWVEWENECQWRGFANLSHMPILNTEDDECADYFINVAEYWTREIKVDGWRLDVANEIGTSFIKKLRNRLSPISNDLWFLGEILHEGNKWIGHKKLTGITNHHWRECIIRFLTGEWTSCQLDECLQMLWHRYPSTFYPGIVNYLNNHDTPRILTCLAEKYDYGTAIHHNCIAAIMLFTSIGSPMIFYGEEIGMEGFGDPDCRKCMEWDISLWDSNKVDSRLKLLETYSKLIFFRKENPWLSMGTWITLSCNVKTLYVYKRIDCQSVALSHQKEKELVVFINVGDRESKLDVFDSLDYNLYRDIIDGTELDRSAFSCFIITPHSGRVFVSC